MHAKMFLVLILLSICCISCTHKKNGGPELLKNLQVELSGFAEYLMAAVISNV